MKTVQVQNIKIGCDNPLVLIAGPCVIESGEIALETARRIVEIAESLGIPFIYKSSYKKDNRSRADAYAGPGVEEGLRILQKIKTELRVPVLSDVHCQTEVDRAAEVLDILQIPAYLSQQTGLTLKVGMTGKPVNVKKGQFTAPQDMVNVVRKLEYTGNYNILLTERGSCFGYRELIVDMRSFPLMRELGYPVVFDVTHTIRLYGTPSCQPSGGQPQFIPYLARAGVACGCDAIFIETHPDPSRAKCDAASMLPLTELSALLTTLVDIDRIVRKGCST
ncbi:2-dehydro-3-deoxyphosphooctonate aldolase [candidate division TA06 bacterium DG_26]|uniref:3-deoxy-8-phosphooctulonate synthase n=1 Tax=candidate division TA06 bacterium DG_26 TaxID=1703771 RepID=A0A0S7WK35_UNCT6|nr:MAG: 2-dehydro-3-deoxyphosphooctonate aldolase [candidate division TA06 bacterium DG_26]